MSGPTRAERLRERVRRTLAPTEPGQAGPNTRRVLRAIVEELGITEAMVDDLDFTDGFEDVADALSTLLAAAGEGE